MRRPVRLSSGGGREGVAGIASVGAAASRGLEVPASCDVRSRGVGGALLSSSGVTGTVT